MGNDNHDLIERIHDIHNKILSNDITAPAELSEIVLPILTARLGKKFTLLFDPDLIDIAVTDAILKYLDNPNQFQVQKGSLIGYLFMSARGDLLNSLHPRKLDQSLVELAEDVEHWDSYAENNVQRIVASDSLSVEEEAFSRLSPLISQIQVLFSDPKDQELVDMMINGIRETDEYAKVLGIENLTFIEQQEIVKKHKDRIKKMISRKIDLNELRDE